MTTTLASDRPSATAGAPDNQFARREREPSQHMRALARANRIRTEQAALKRRIGAMEKGEALEFVADLLLNPDGVVNRMKLDHLLRAIPYMGVAKITRMLQHLELPALVLHRKVGPCPPPRSGQRVLTARQRESMSVALRDYAKRVGS